MEGGHIHGLQTTVANHVAGRGNTARDPNARFAKISQRTLEKARRKLSRRRGGGGGFWAGNTKHRIGPFTTARENGDEKHAFLRSSWASARACVFALGKLCVAQLPTLRPARERIGWISWSGIKDPAVSSAHLVLVAERAQLALERGTPRHQRLALLCPTPPQPPPAPAQAPRPSALSSTAHTQDAPCAPSRA